MQWYTEVFCNRSISDISIVFFQQMARHWQHFAPPSAAKAGYFGNTRFAAD
ncbi:MAG: hypothetical protein NXH74_13425 [Rhodobacteraceae bacterium]|nr:hypothetical protein [Paracoccaceae bacterium]